MIWDKICCIFDKLNIIAMTIKFFTKKVSVARKAGIDAMNSAELGSALVRISHKINSRTSKGQLVKVGDKYYRIRELG